MMALRYLNNCDMSRRFSFTTDFLYSRFTCHTYSSFFSIMPRYILVCNNFLRTSVNSGKKRTNLIRLINLRRTFATLVTAASGYEFLAMRRLLDNVPGIKQPLHPQFVGTVGGSPAEIQPAETDGGGSMRHTQ
jgi:hypothetical protein